MKRFDRYSTWIVAFIFVIAVIAVYKTFDNFKSIAVFLGNLITVVKPFIIGFVIAYLLNIPCTKMQELLDKTKIKILYKYRKIISILTVYIVMLGFVTILIRMVVPAIYQNIIDMYTNFPTYMKLAMDYIANLPFDHVLFNIDQAMIEQKIMEFIGSIDITKFGQYAQGVINVTSGVIGIFISFVISVYMILDKDQIKETIYKVALVFISKHTLDKIIMYVKSLNDIFSKYIYCQLLDALIVATLSIIVLSLLKVKYALVLGILVGACNLIPYFGAIIGIISVVLITIFTGGFTRGIWTAVSLVVMQQIDANIIGPKIMSNSLEIRPLWVIFSVTVGGGLFGVAGMVLSVPVFAMIKKILGDYLKERSEKNLK